MSGNGELRLVATPSFVFSLEGASGALPGLPHFPPKAKRVIFLHMAGAPSHLELFDAKPQLEQAERWLVQRALAAGNAVLSPLIGEG